MKNRRPRVLFCGMRSILEDPAAAANFRCLACKHEWVGKQGDIGCPVCGSERAILLSQDVPVTNARRSPL